MSRIQKRFEWLQSKSEKALVAFITAGDPDLATTQELFSVIEEGGADIIELGVPFSDPLADGPVIQAASQRSLKSGTTLKKIIQLVRENIRKLFIANYCRINSLYATIDFVRSPIDRGRWRENRCREPCTGSATRYWCHSH